MEQLKACYEKYFAEADEVWKNRSAWDGALGIGSSSKDHPCHIAFYRSVEKWVETFTETATDSAVAEEAVSFVLGTSESHKGQFTYWTLFAAHGLMKPLVDHLTPEAAARLRNWYDENILRRDRLPVHKELYKKLKKRERA